MRDFDHMRARLQDQGLIDADHRLTAAGHAHVEKTIEQLRDAPPPAAEEPIFWHHSFRQRNR